MGAILDFKKIQDGRHENTIFLRVLINEAARRSNPVDTPI
jgi:hypothetical protein